MKQVIWIGMVLGSTIGSFIPSLWGAGIFSFSSLFLGALGGAIGIFIAFKLTH
jgi:hypothetical protein